MARVNRTTGAALILGVILLVGTVTGVNLLNPSNHSAVTAGPSIEAGDIFGSGRVDVRSRLSHPTAALPPGFAAVVAKVEVQEMDRVKKDDVLIRLDDTQAQADLNSAEATLLASKFSVDKAKVLVIEHQSKIQQQRHAVEIAKRSHALAKIKFEQAEKANKAGLIQEDEVRSASETVAIAYEHVLNEMEKFQALEKVDPEHAVKAAEAEVATHERMVEKARAVLKALVIKAPGDGTILALNISAGESLGTLAPSMAPPITFQPDGPLIVRAEVDQERAGRVHEGMKVTLHLHGADGGQQWTGTVERIAAWITRPKSLVYAPELPYDPRTRECIIRLDPGQPPPMLHMQMSVQIHTK
jgi:HlyD family secretion protein